MLLYIFLNFFSRLFEASEAARVRAVPLHPQLGGGDHLHLLRARADPRLRPARDWKRDDWPTIGLAGPPAGFGSLQDDQCRQVDLDQRKLGQRPYPGLLHRVTT